ncbi:MAG: hypothetical protein AAF349_03295 [Cyanobacteria bacterium P01_A01_bin.68]
MPNSTHTDDSLLGCFGSHPRSSPFTADATQFDGKNIPPSTSPPKLANP